MDFYKILNIDKNASKKEIKKAYHILAVKYHPDKYNGIDKDEKFKEINIAYQILSDDEKRKQYDMMTVEERNYMNTILYDFFQGAKNVLYQYIKTNLSTIYNDPNIVDQIISEASQDDVIDSSLSISDLQVLDIVLNIEVGIKEVYQIKMKEIEFVKKIDGKQVNVKKQIPIMDNQIIYEGEGDVINGGKGKLIINIKYKYNKYQIKGNNIYRTFRISLYEYLYGIRFAFRYLDDNKITVYIKKPVYELEKHENDFLYCYRGKGLLYDIDNKTRGDFYIKFELDWTNHGNMETEQFLKACFGVYNKK